MVGRIGAGGGRLSAAAFTVAAMAGLCAGAWAQDAPSVDAIVAKYIDAVGGKDALAKVKSRVMKGTFSLPDMGIEAKMEIYIQPPNAYTLVNVESMGMSVENGISNGVAWTMNPMEGNRILEGAEKTQALQQAAIEPMLNWKEIFEKAEVAGEANVGDAACYKVVFTPKEGDPVTVYFDKESGLIRQRDQSQQGMMVSSKVEEYKEVGGVKVAAVMKSEGGMINPVITFATIEDNVDIPAEKFNLPDAIKALQAPAASSAPQN